MATRTKEKRRLSGPPWTLDRTLGRRCSRAARTFHKNLLLLFREASFKSTLNYRASCYHTTINSQAVTHTIAGHSRGPLCTMASHIGRRTRRRNKSAFSAMSSVGGVHHLLFLLSFPSFSLTCFAAAVACITCRRPSDVVTCTQQVSLCTHGHVIMYHSFLCIDNFSFTTIFLRMHAQCLSLQACWTLSRAAPSTYRLLLRDRSPQRSDVAR